MWPMHQGATQTPKKQALAPVALDREDLPALGMSPTDSRFDLRCWWPAERRNLPVELEIGSGKGTFLVQQATANDQTNFLGIEWAREYWHHAADRFYRNGLMHVRMLHVDAAEFVRWHCLDHIFKTVHIYFPDPWPKKRHHKRRLVQAPFLRELHRVLVREGHVRIVTDHDDYFEWMQSHAAQVNELFDRLPFAPLDSTDENEVVGTNFERKYRREGRPFHAMILQRTAS